MRRMTLPEIIFERIPAAMLERVAYDQGIMDEARFTALFKASGLSPQQTADKIVEAYGDKAAKLAFGLYQQINETDWETARDLYEHFNKSPEFQYDNHQASLRPAKRRKKSPKRHSQLINTLSEPAYIFPPFQIYPTC